MNLETFTIDPVSWHNGSASIDLTCRRCGKVILEDTQPVSLDTLLMDAAAHGPFCQAT